MEDRSFGDSQCVPLHSPTNVPRATKNIMTATQNCKSRHARHSAKVREEILHDTATYQDHPHIDTVVVLVHDTNHFIPIHERASFEADLSQSVSVGGRTICYFTRVR